MVYNILMMCFRVVYKESKLWWGWGWYKICFDKVDGHYHDLWEVIISIEEPLHLLSCCKSLEECHCGKSSKLEESWVIL
jgi:hypothetical protein